MTPLGLVALCRVRHVYAADRFSVMLLSRTGRETGDDLTLQLPARSTSVLRPCDPPLLALRMFDPHAVDGKTSLQPGPCPIARNFAKRMIKRSEAAVLHIPSADRRGWLDALTAGAILVGELYLIPSGTLPHPDPPPDSGPDDDDDPDPACSSASLPIVLQPGWRLSEQLIEAGHARAA